MTFLKTVIPAEVKPITAFEDYDNKKSSHPNVRKRKDQYIEILIELPKYDNKKDFHNLESLIKK